MVIRTISQLPTTNTLNNNMLFEVSVPQNTFGDQNDIVTGYISQKTNFGTIQNTITTQIENNIKNDYQLIDNYGNKINVNSLKNEISEIKNNNLEIDGIKTFKKIPNINAAYNDIQPSNVATVGYVDVAIQEKIPYSIGSMSNYDAAKTETSIINESNLMKWIIDAGAKTSNEIVCQKTGNLVIYGWLADNGNTISQNAWVGLFGQINNEWILLQLQPWIIGQKSSVMQYVGFNIPVKTGLRLKIQTGFAVNGSNSVQMNTFGWGLQTVNNFAGYILY